MKPLLTTKKENVGLEASLASRLKKLLFCSLFLGIGFCQAQSYAQQYTLKDIEVEGLESYDPEVIMSYAELSTGIQIYLDGARIKHAIKKLWELKAFQNISFSLKKTKQGSVSLKILLQELPSLRNIHISGIKKRKRKRLLEKSNLKQNNNDKKLTKNLISDLKNSITQHYKERGFLNTTVNIQKKEVNATQSDLHITIEKNKKNKISTISVDGNEFLKDKSFKKLLKKTKERAFFRIFKRSRFIKDDFNKDLERVVTFYKEKGFRNAQIMSDSLYYTNNKLNLNIKIKEGIKYHFGNITFLGNSAYTDDKLSKILSIRKGEIYNEKLLQSKVADFKNPYANDISNLYQNNGYLFSSVRAVETGVNKDTINFEIRITEGKQAHINEVKVIGNTRTNDHVIYRELRTLPGSIYRKSELIRSHRELAQLDFFDTEKIVPNIKNANAHEGLVDLEYSVEEKGTSQIELQAGYGNRSFVGTLGLSFKNFSLNNIFNKKAYKPLPMGDGQTLAFRYQVSRYSNVGSISISDPWFGGKKPNRLSFSTSYSANYGYDTVSFNRDTNKRIFIFNVSVGLAKRLSVPDDYFSLSHNLTYKNYNVKNFELTPTLDNGKSNDFNYTIGLSRNDLYLNPFFPIGGSRFSLVAKFTPPYSLFDGTNYKEASESEKIKWIEYYKLIFKGDWYTKIVGKLILKSSFNMGYIGPYNTDKGLSYFERFFLGGGGMALNTNFYGTDIIALRGYPDPSTQDKLGDVIYSKLSFELRYPLVLSAMSSLYIHAFAEGGTSSTDVSSYDPFENKRSAGFGIKYFMPALGIIGFDFGHGFDQLNGETGWQTHFTIGQSF